MTIWRRPKATAIKGNATDGQMVVRCFSSASWALLDPAGSKGPRATATRRRLTDAIGGAALGGEERSHGPHGGLVGRAHAETATGATAARMARSWASWEDDALPGEQGGLARRGGWPPDAEPPGDAAGPTANASTPAEPAARLALTPRHRVATSPSPAWGARRCRGRAERNGDEEHAMTRQAVRPGPSERAGPSHWSSGR